MRTGSTIVRYTLMGCFGFCAIGFAQSNSITNRTPIILAQKGDNPGAAKNLAVDQKAADKKQLPNVNKARRNELMAFVKEHHPAIRPLLNSIQKTRPTQYQAALRTLDREVKSLQSLEKRSPEKHEKSLARWIAKSKIKLLSAQLAIKNSLQEQQAIEKQIFVLIQKQQDLLIQIVAADAKIAEKRLAKYKADLARLKANRKSEIERQMDVIKGNSQRIRLAQKKAADAKKKAASNKKKPSTEKPPVDKNDKSRLKDNKTNPKG